jgi:ubiquinone biosynthesis protein
MANSPVPHVPWRSRLSMLNRSQQIVSTMARHGVDWLITGMGSGSGGSAQLLRKVRKQVHPSQAGQFVAALAELGPTFIKFGQALSARADLLPPEYIEALSTLQDLVPPVPFKGIQAVLTAELGKDPKEIFAEINTTPLASASIGQVYAARLWTGEDVVVKVVRPGAEKMFEQDIEILTDMADWAAQHTAIGKLYDLPALIDEFAYTVRAEFDYLREGRNAESFKRNFSTDIDVYIPSVHWEYTTRRVITLERVAGLKINDLAGLEAAGINRQIVAENLMHFALRQIFEFGLYHADPHPGNFFVQPDGSLAVVDFGMVGRLSNKTKLAFFGIAQAVERRDSDVMVDELLNYGIFTGDVDRKSFARDIQRLFDRFSSASIVEMSATQVLTDIMAIILRNGLQLPSELVAMTRAITISEGTGMALYPDFKLLDFAAPYVRRFWKEERSPKKMMPLISQTMLDSMELGLDMPRRINRLMNQVERGQLQVGLNPRFVGEMMSQLQKMTNRMTLGMILSAVIIALALVMVIYRSETWQVLGNWIFGFALISSIIFGIWLIWSILRSGRT